MLRSIKTIVVSIATAAILGLGGLIVSNSRTATAHEQRIGAVEQRAESTDKRFDRIDQKLDILLDRTARIEGQLGK